MHLAQAGNQLSRACVTCPSAAHAARARQACSEGFHTGERATKWGRRPQTWILQQGDPVQNMLSKPKTAREAPGLRLAHPRVLPFCAAAPQTKSIRTQTGPY